MKFIKLTEVVSAYKYRDCDPAKDPFGNTRERYWDESTNPIFVNISRANYMRRVPGKKEGRKDYTLIQFHDTEESICCVDVTETPEEIMARFT